MAMAATEALRILIIDDSLADRTIYRSFLSDLPGFEPRFIEADRGTTGLQLLHDGNYDCVLLDYCLPDMNGMEVLGSVQRLAGPVLMLTGFESTQLAVSAMHRGVFDFMSKATLSRNAIHRATLNAVEKFRLQHSLELSHDDLERTVADLRQRNDEIRSFYHTLSHELKTPLTAAQEFIALVLDGLAGDINDTQREYLETARRSCLRLGRHINDILDVTRLETGKVHMDMAMGSLGRMAQEVLRVFLERAESKGLSLIFEQDPTIPDISFDEDRMRQVLSNLIDNAIKYTSHGQITVSIRGGVDELSISVADTGRGIPAEHLDLVFNRLHQVCDTDAAIESGLGLGLNICRELVELHGGRIDVESAPGIGSTFRVGLPTVDAGRQHDRLTAGMSQ